VPLSQDEHRISAGEAQQLQLNPLWGLPTTCATTYFLKFSEKLHLDAKAEQLR
jgi:hypothetical protein